MPGIPATHTCHAPDMHPYTWPVPSTCPHKWHSSHPYMPCTQAPNHLSWADLHLILAAEQNWDMPEPANQRKAGHAKLDYVNL